MNDLNKKELSETLIEHIDKEGLHTHETARLLNILPQYVSMAKNEKSWDHIPRSAWERINDWFYTRGPLATYEIPKDEAVLEIFLQKEKPAIVTSDKTEATIQIQKEQKPRKQKQGKSVKLMINSARMEALEKRMQGLEEQNLLLVNDNNQLSQEIEKLRKELPYMPISDGVSHIALGAIINELKNKLFVMENETLAVMRSKIDEALTRAKENEEGISHLVTIPKQTVHPSVVIFQRNIYKP